MTIAEIGGAPALVVAIYALFRLLEWIGKVVVDRFRSSDTNLEAFIESDKVADISIKNLTDAISVIAHSSKQQAESQQKLDRVVSTLARILQRNNNEIRELHLTTKNTSENVRSLSSELTRIQRNQTAMHRQLNKIGKMIQSQNHDIIVKK